MPTWLMSPIVRSLIVIIAILCGIMGAYVKGRHDGAALTEAAVKAEKDNWEKKISELQSSQDLAVQDITTEYKRKEHLYLVEIDKWKKLSKTTPSINNPPPVIPYVPARVDVVVNKGFVDLHDTSASGLPSSDVEKPTSAEPSSIKLSTVAATVAGNYYQCNKYIVQLSSLQDIVSNFIQKQESLTK